MPPLAVSCRWPRCDTALHVRGARHCFEVVGVHAQRVPAQVVDVQAVRNRADEEAMRHAMRVGQPAVLGVPELSVARAVRGPHPLPALPRLAASDLAVEPLLQGGVAAHAATCRLGPTLTPHDGHSSLTIAVQSQPRKSAMRTAVTRSIGRVPSSSLLRSAGSLPRCFARSFCVDRPSSRVRISPRLGVTLGIALPAMWAV